MEKTFKTLKKAREFMKDHKPKLKENEIMYEMSHKDGTTRVFIKEKAIHKKPKNNGLMY